MAITDFGHHHGVHLPNWNQSTFSIKMNWPFLAGVALNLALWSILILAAIYFLIGPITASFAR